jgi:2-oxoglutarate ferredoxin oxidoreductase subunit gamma
MQTEAIFAGFGGQGVLFAGQMLAFAALEAGKEVTWIPSYGPEMRGGTANCTVIIADEEIGSPMVRNPKIAVIFNLPSLDKYEPMIIKRGVLIANASLINRPFNRTDLDSVMVPANEIAEEIGNKRLVNVVMLGALMSKAHVLTMDEVESAIRRYMPVRHKKLLPMNLEALRRGAAFARGETVRV